MTSVEQPMISVILPTFNRAYILPKAIESVLAQTYAHWELIIVDDGSTDTTHAAVMKFSDPRIRYVKHPENKGLAASRNTGIRESCGTYIANLDSDDVWLPQKLEKELAVFKKTPPLVYVVYSEYERTLGDGRVAHLPEVARERNGDLRSTLLAVNLISMQMALVKKELFEKVGYFDERIPALQDWEFWIRASQYTHFAFLPEILTRGVVLEDSIANNQKKRLQGRELIFTIHEQAFKIMPAVYADHAFRIGHTYALRGEITHAIPYLTKAWTAKPLHIKHAAGLLLAICACIFHSPAWYKSIASHVS